MPLWEHFHHSPWFPLKTVCRNSSSNEQKPKYKKRKNENLKQMIRCKRIPTPTNPQSNPSPPPLVSYTIVAVLFKLRSTWSVKPSSWKLCKLGVGPYLIPEIGDTHPPPPFSNHCQLPGLQILYFNLYLKSEAENIQWRFARYRTHLYSKNLCWKIITT